MKKIPVFIFMFVLFSVDMFSFSSCKKYEEGPLLSISSKKSRLTAKWKLKDVTLLETGENVFSHYANFVMIINKDGTITHNYTKRCTKGNWIFNDDKYELKIYWDYPNYYSSHYEIWDIIRLSHKDLILLIPVYGYEIEENWDRVHIGKFKFIIDN